MTSLHLRGLEVSYGAVIAADAVDLAVLSGQSVGLVGESGSGKSTVARAIAGLIQLSGGEIALDSTVVRTAGTRPKRLPDVQMVFQNPYASLNSRMTVGQTIGEVCRTQGIAKRAARTEVERLLDLVELPMELYDSYPHQMSGGQRQRVAIARALASNPKILVLDEVTSALDVSVQAVILNVLQALRRELNLSYLVISHDLSVVRYLCDSVSVMYLGRIVESGSTASVLGQPRHPYTKTLVDALTSELDSTTFVVDAPPRDSSLEGCRFHSRCPVGQHIAARERCMRELPLLRRRIEDSDSLLACHYPVVEQQSPPSVQRAADFSPVTARQASGKELDG